MKKRILFSVAAIGLALYAGAATAQQLSLAQISQYLNGLQTAQGGFTQINQDGTLSTGTIYIKRPGRIRFDYAAPDNTLVIGGGGSLAIFDPRSNAGPERYPLNQTPLGLILRDNVNLEQADMVTGVTSDGTTTTVTAQDPDHPEYGNIQLKFTGDPVELRQWVINDDSGSSTTVVLGELTKGGSLPNTLFDIDANMKKRGGR